MERPLSLLLNGVRSLLSHPKMIFVVLLVFVFPVLLAYVMYFFLNTASVNYTSISRARTGMLHDSAKAIIASTPTNEETAALSTLISSIKTGNPDVSLLWVAKAVDSKTVTIVAASDEEMIGTNDNLDETYRRALISPDTPIAYEFFESGERYWETTSTLTEDGTLDTYYIVSVQNFSGFDDLIAEREWYAYALLAVAFFFLFLLALWLIKSIDYQMRYEDALQKISEQHQISNMIAHELRSPLTAMRGYASMIIESEAVDSKASLYATEIDKATTRLIDLVSEFLDIARIQSGQLKVEKRLHNVADTLNQVVHELGPLATEKGLELSFANKEERLEINTDPARLIQIITNITSNSIKYTKSGKITIETEWQKNKLEIRIKDTGAGISAEEQQHLFTPFHRVENSDTKKIIGTGLGMWITKRLVDSLGGTIGVESIKDIGTNVVISLPKS